MKRTYLIAWLLLMTGSLAAQEKGGISYGFKAGGHLTANYGAGTEHYTVRPRFNYHVGLYGKYDLTDKISLQPELLFTQRSLYVRHPSTSTQQFSYPGVPYGSSQYLLGTDQPMQRDITTQAEIFYLDVPVAAHYQLTDQIRAHAGVMYSAYLFNTGVYHTYGPGQDTKQPEDLRPRYAYERGDFDLFEKHQFGVFAGGSYHFDFGLQAGLRGNLGLTRINRPMRGGRDLQYSMIQVYAAYDLSQLFQ